MQALPTGNVTFLFTDIEGSTTRWDHRPVAMQSALAHHDAVMREAIESHDGVVFKTIGDAFCAAFHAAHDGLAAALHAQASLAGADWGQVETLPVRMALHTGVAQLRDEDYFGPPLNRLARLLEVAAGGQILLSHATFELVCDSLPDGVRLRDLGDQHLRDLQRPEHSFAVVSADVAATAAHLAASRGDYTAAQRLLEESVSLARETDDPARIERGLLDLGVVARLDGEYDLARTRLHEALTMARDRGHESSVSSALKQLGIVAHDQGDYDLCSELIRESLSVQRHVSTRLLDMPREDRPVGWRRMLRPWRRS
jgi:class 3 adenylate cyclase